MLRLEGKVALITGAATGVEGKAMGLGGATARLFAREGAKVVLPRVRTSLMTVGWISSSESIILQLARVSQCRTSF